jgi:hypothetical protein
VERAIRCHPNYGPIFGKSRNILVENYPNSKNASYSRVDKNCYQLPKDSNGLSLILNGERNF